MSLETELPGLPSPAPVSPPLLAFPVAEELDPPSLKDIPLRFHGSGGPTRTLAWSRIMMSIFYSQRDPRTLSFIPRPGVRGEDAYNTLMVFVGSRDLKHEHKEALCGYGLWSWFSAVLVGATGDVLVCDDDIDPEELKKDFLERHDD